MDKPTLIGWITSAFSQYASTAQAPPVIAIPPDITEGKLYEAFVLANVLDRLRTQERLWFQTQGSSKLQLKGAPGPINSSYPSIRALDGLGQHVATIWTDVEVMTLSYSHTRPGQAAQRGDYHELDIVMVDNAATGRPLPNQLWLGVECKHTSYQKAYLRQILGTRRELSLLADETPTRFKEWPRAVVRANPPSCLLACSSDPTIEDFKDPGNFFGIDILHIPVP